MQLFRKSPQPWSPSWTYDAGTYIWRFVFTGDGSILGEARDPVKKTASFFCIGEADGSPRWEGLRVKEDWWVGLETVDAGRFYLHGYRKPDMPQHIGIRAFDLHSGQALWANEELTFVLARRGDVYAAREGFSGIDFFRLSPDDGSVSEELGQDIERINILRQLLNEEDDFTGYRYPEAFAEGHPAFAASAEAVQRIVDPSQVVGNLDVLVEPPLVLAAWHEAIEANGSRPVLRQKFEALHLPSGRTLFQDVLLDEADAPGMDSFFLKDEQLLYIRNRCILTAHHLNGVPA